MTFSEEVGNPEDQFLTDFLYVERQRLASYTAQLFPDGNLTSMKKVSGLTEQSAMKFGGGVPKLLNADHTSTDTAVNSIEHSFDANWSSIIDALSEINAKGFVKEFSESVAIGQIIHFKGNINIMDFRLLQKLWRPVMKGEISKMPAHTKPQQVAKKAQESAVASMVDVIELMPHLIQLSAFNSKYSLWCTLNSECMAIDPADLAFKYGPSIDGEWSVIAVIDAWPFNDDNHQINYPPGLGDIQNALLQMAVQIRIGFGRPLNSYGITPLAIYRTLKNS